MISSKKNKTLQIDKEAVSSLELLKEGLLAPATSLMNEEETKSVLNTGLINGKSFPFPFILAPAGKKNEEVLKTLEVGEEITLMFENKPFATLIVDEIFKIKPRDRIKHIYGTDDINHPGVSNTLKRIGSFAISGEYELINKSSTHNKQAIEKAKKLVNPKHISSLIMSANPLHRAHERLIRQALENTDLLIIFLLKYTNETNLNYEIRKDSLDYFINNFLTKNHVIVVPLEYSYVFQGFNEIIIDAIVSKNYGCDRLIIGRNHYGLGMFYDENLNKSIIDKVIGIDIEIVVSSEFVYCNKCRTLVSKNTCPHGQHHQISYHSDSILELLKLGLLPPTILVRKEISAQILTKLFPKRFKNLEKLYHVILPANSFLEEHTEKDFYLKLMKLYQTTSLT